MVVNLFFLLIALFFGVSKTAEAALTHTEAQIRSQQISNVEYKIDLNLTQSEYNPIEDTKQIPTLPLYSGKVVAQFKASPNAKIAEEFFFDFKSQEGASLKNILVNGNAIQARWDKSAGKIFLPTSVLKLGDINQVQIEFSNRFTRNGKGFHRALDQEDKEIYIFTNLEPFHANEVFPVFDQPDLKAHFQLETEVPSHWEVVSNTREIKKEDLGSHHTKWTFGRTEKFSTYLFALVAGPFHIWTPKEQSHIPMRLLARKTLAKYVDADDWFKMTRESFAFYEKHFGKYAFQKYDQILVPETSSGAMENVGAVTFNESYTSRGKMTPSERTALVAVISHEMAHMWFGDLVTMKWWDDLWLNESFASFASALVGEDIQQSLELLNSWEFFFSRRKPAAYQTDGYHTTHPIVVQVDDTDMASSIFDDITYGKGSASLKQLYFYVGKENFFNGIRRYLDNFRFQNATRTDFIDALSSVSGIELKNWDEEWLQTRGTNALQISLTEKNGKIEKLALTPFPEPMDNKSRVHRTQVGLYQFNSEGKIVLQQVIPVTYYADPVEIQSVVGNPVPVFVFGNVGDFDFTREILDARNLNQLQSHLAKLEDPLLKQQIYLSLWNMVQNAELPASEFIDLLTQNSLLETNANTLNELFANLRKTLVFARPNERVALNEKISEFLWNKLQISQSGSPEQDNVFRNFLSFTRSYNHRNHMIAWLNGNETINGIQFTQDNRWRLIIALAANNYPNIEEIIQTESLKDKSNQGQLSANVARTKIPSVDNKKTWFKNLTTPKQMNSSDSKSVAGALHDILNESLTSFVEEQYFDAILNLIRNRDDSGKIANLVSNLYPIYASNDFSIKANQFIEEHKDEITPNIKRAILDKMEDAARIRKASALIIYSN